MKKSHHTVKKIKNRRILLSNQQYSRQEMPYSVS